MDECLRFVYCDESLVVCLKPPGVRSTDEPGGMPELVRRTLGDPTAQVRTVHRLDQVVGGLMVLARGAQTAEELSRQLRDGQFHKEYLAVVHGTTPACGELRDLLRRDTRLCKTFVTETPGKGVQEAVLTYRTLQQAQDMSKLQIQLQTGRTHQIRTQFSARALPLVGDRKYGLPDDECPIALWSYRLQFLHPVSGRALAFAQEPPECFPWSLFTKNS